jgi:hypothetical protein
MNYSYIREITKDEWNDLWQSKKDDKIRAESISVKKYAWLEIEKGEIIRDSRRQNLDFHTILENNYGLDKAAKINPDPSIGGYKKFIKDSIKKRRAPREAPKIDVDVNQPQRKRGRGWKNQIRISRKKRERE